MERTVESKERKSASPAADGVAEKLRDADALVARRNYPRAVDLLRQAAAARPGDATIRLRLAEALAGGGPSEAATIFDEVARELATAGFTAKAIAVYKRLQRLRPDAEVVERRLAELIRQRSQEIARPRSHAPGAEPEGGDATTPSAAPGSNVEAGSPPAADEATNGIALSPLFRDLDADELVELLRGFQLRTFHSGEIVVSEGEPGDSL